MSKIDLYKGDCLEIMDKLIEKGVVVDAIIADAPYNTTACEWDSLIPFNDFLMQSKSKRSSKLQPVYRDEYILQELKNNREYKEICDFFDKNSNEGMWQKLNKLIKPNGAIVLFGSEPFSSALRMSNIKDYKYDWAWVKDNGTGFLNSKKQPLRNNEQILVFYKKQSAYNPQMRKGFKPYKSERKGKSFSDNYGNQVNVTTVSNGDRYPLNTLTFTRDGSKLHPTQKPVALMEYLVKTYTNEGELVLDFTMGSGTTGVACQNTNRDFIGIEMDECYFDIAKKRIENTAAEKRLLDE
ncbi:MAG: site-specific DNA-methyltransferase [Campylobacterota bacterium]|nr:site-specific DNA-methyltransferase [Campylobacterota bacterium]